MTEAFSEYPDYFTENNELLDGINNKILDRISDNPLAVIAFDLEQNASDTIINHEALPVHHARMAVEQLIALASPFQHPIGSIFARSQLLQAPYTTLELTMLTNTNEEPFAIRSVTTQKSDDVLDITTITHINGTCTEATHHVIPEKSELTDMINAYITDIATQTELISLLRYHTPHDNIDTLLAEIFERDWFTPVSTAESHLASLIKNHIASEREARQFAAQLHIDKPSANDLRQLFHHLQ